MRNNTLYTFRIDAIFYELYKMSSIKGVDSGRIIYPTAPRYEFLVCLFTAYAVSQFFKSTFFLAG